MIPKRIKIKFHGPPYQAIAYDAETDEVIPNIKRVDLVSVDVNNEIYEARLVVDIASEVIEGEVIAASRVPPTLSDAEVDELAKRVERRIAQHLRLQGSMIDS